MSIIALTEKRYTAKAYDKNKKISQADLNKLCQVLRNTPSSVNSQPWHFFVLGTDEAKTQIKDAIMEFNQPRVMDASHVIVMCAYTELSEAYFQKLLEQEDKDGRFTNEENKKGQDSGRRYFVGLNNANPDKLIAWESKQIYIAAGFLMLAAASLDIDTTPIEGFISEKMDELLNLQEQGLKSIFVMTLGYHNQDDFNAQLPKSRLPKEQIFTFM